MRRLLAGVIFGWLSLGTFGAAARADGGTLCLSGETAGYRITVFSAPVPLRAGPVDISVFVQDSATGLPMPEAQATVRLTKPGQGALEGTATRAAATNKLFLATMFELTASGRWELEVQVAGLHGPAAIRGEVQAAERLPRWRELWPWIGWPALPIALFVVLQVRNNYTGRDRTRLRGTEPQPYHLDTR
jgi:hypothetical protein